jgi:hypothetical protein
MRAQSVWGLILGAFVVMLVLVGYLQFPASSAAAATLLSPAPVPTVTGTAKVGSTLTAVPGTWARPR